MTIAELDENQLKQVYVQMEKDFPPSELKSLQTIEELRARGVYDAWAAYGDDGTYVGYALVYHPNEGREILLDYLAIEPGLHGHGYGQLMLQALLQHYQNEVDSMMIECERPKTAPDEELARRRIRFYEKAGAQLTSVRIWLFDVEYSILVLPCNPIEPQDWAEKMLALYRGMLPPMLYERNVRLIRG